MAVREVRVAGRAYLALVTSLLHRVRSADPEAGLWEAADLQWWWRTPRSSDTVEQVFWSDRDGPIAAFVLTEWSGQSWGCDPIIVPGSTIDLATIWARAVETIGAMDLRRVEVLARDDDAELLRLLAETGFAPVEGRSGTTWMEAVDRPPIAPLPTGLILVDRTRASAGPHPMRRRSGEAVEERLRQCSLYDPALDLAIETGDGATAGYALFWADPITGVGLVEPMRVEDEYQRRGLARSLLTAGLDRLVGRGARRLKVGFSTDAARSLYLGAGFRLATLDTVFRRDRAEISSLP